MIFVAVGSKLAAAAAAAVYATHSKGRDSSILYSVS